jgi:hypothetical protein
MAQKPSRAQAQREPRQRMPQTRLQQGQRLSYRQRCWTMVA